MNAPDPQQVARFVRACEENAELRDAFQRAINLVGAWLTENGPRITKLAEQLAVAQIPEQKGPRS